MKNKSVTARLDIEFPILIKGEDNFFPVDLGSLWLKLGDRNFVVDSDSTDFDFGEEDEDLFYFMTVCYKDLDTFSENKECNYNLTEEDLLNPDLEATFYCHEINEGTLDYNNVKIECIVSVDGTLYTIKNVKLEQ